MAWGCFCWIPCPYKKWDEAARPAMLTMLPLLGACLGLLTGVIWTLLVYLGASSLLTGAVVTAAYFLMTGFIHLDGYMDCCDAILPRHPDMERRREILKDPHTGAFAAIGMAMMLLVFAGSAAGISDAFSGAAAVTFALITTVSRAMSAATVLTAAPMQTSQYRNLEDRSPAKAGPVIVVTVLAFIAAAAVIRFCSIQEPMQEIVCCIASGLVTAAVCLITGAADRRALGGMNGDISGHMIVTGEMAGILTAALLLAQDTVLLLN